MPSNLIGFSAIIGLLLLIFRRTKWAVRCFAFSAILITTLGYSPLPNRALLALENRFPQLTPAQITLKPAGIIILGGSFNPYLSFHRNEVNLNDTIERVTQGIELSRIFPNAPLIFTGSSVPLSHSHFPTEAILAKRMLDGMGIDTSRIIFEDKSLTTYENAQFLAAILKPNPSQHYVLVTSAFHMPRSVALFRAAGFTVQAYPVDYQLPGLRSLFLPHTYMTSGVSVADIAAKEWLGMLVYWATGKITEFYPRP